MSDYKEMVRKMRTCIGDKKCFEKECRYWSELGCMDGNICCDAAAAIEALQADIKRLKEANNELREAQTYIDHYGNKWMTSAKDVPTSAYNHGYMDGWGEAIAKMEVQDA